MDRNTRRGPPERNSQTGAGSSGGHGGAGSSGSPGGAGSSEGHGGAGSSEGHGRSSLGPWPQSPRPGPYSRHPYYPPNFFSMGQIGGNRSPLGLNTQDRTGQPSGARQTGQDSPQQPPPLPRQGDSLPRRVSMDKTRHDKVS